MDAAILGILSPLTLLTAAVAATLTVLALLRHGRRAQRGPPRAVVNIGGVPVDLNASLQLEWSARSPPGFVARRPVGPSDVAARVRAIPWFTRCGDPFAFALSMETRAVASWGEAMRACTAESRERAQLEAQNQLSHWLFLHARNRFNRDWNALVERHRAQVVSPLRETLHAVARSHALDPAFVFVGAVEWDILGTLVENSFLDTGHQVFHFLERLTVYEAGHFPCGWDGEWPRGKLLVL